MRGAEDGDDGTRVAPFASSAASPHARRTDLANTSFLVSNSALRNSLDKNTTSRMSNSRKSAETACSGPEAT